MNGQHFILWTESEGGFFKAIKVDDREMYDAAVETGTLLVRRNDIEGARYDQYTPVFIAFGAVEANHDFILGSSREP